MPAIREEDPKAAWKRRREERQRERQSPQHLDGKDDNDKQSVVDSYQPFTSAAKRRRIEQEELLARRRGGHAPKTAHQDEDQQNSHGPKEHSNLENPEVEVNEANPEQRTLPAVSLLDAAAALQEKLTDQERQDLQRKEEEIRIMREASQVQTNALQAASEVASGKVYADPMPSTWTVPKYILEQGEEEWNKIRQEWHMDVEGNDIPPPMKRFKDMRLPAPILTALSNADSNAGLASSTCRSRYGWYCLYWVWQNLDLLLTSCHDVARGRIADALDWRGRSHWVYLSTLS
jgi:ATP-dependent RNA helicase DDX41